MMLNIFSCANWPFVYVPWRKVCSEPWSFLNWVVLLRCTSSSYILIQVSDQREDLQVSSPFLYVIFSFCVASFEVQVFNLNEVQFIYFVACAFSVISKKILPNPRSWRFTPMCFSDSVLVSALKLRPLTHAEFILCTTWDKGALSSFCMWISSCPSTICWKDYSSPIDWSWLQMIFWH